MSTIYGVADAEVVEVGILIRLGLIAICKSSQKPYCFDHFELGVI